jgi:NAD(P)-dependent dehydrogenase (short-subunit alcohol dehydrogenase family)
LAAAGGGTVINTSSMVALMGYPGSDAYTASKGAIAALTRSMAVEYASQRVRVNALAPGVTLTDRVADRVAQGAVPQRVLDRHLLGLLDPLQVVRSAMFLASDASHGITGQVIPVDSGATIG